MEPTRPEVPSDWPETAELDGSTVNLRAAVAKLPIARITELLVVLPGSTETSRPWRFLLDDDDPVQDEDGGMYV